MQGRGFPLPSFAILSKAEPVEILHQVSDSVIVWSTDGHLKIRHREGHTVRPCKGEYRLPSVYRHGRERHVSETSQIIFRQLCSSMNERMAWAKL